MAQCYPPAYLSSTEMNKDVHKSGDGTRPVHKELLGPMEEMESKTVED